MRSQVSPKDGYPRPHHASMAQRAASTPAPEVGAQCGNPARWDLSGGPSAKGGPTATIVGASDPGGGVAEVVAGLGVVHRHCCDLQLGGDRVRQLLCLAGGGLDGRGQCLGDTGAGVAADRARLREGSGTGLGEMGDRVIGRGGAILYGPGGNGDEDSFGKGDSISGTKQEVSTLVAKLLTLSVGNPTGSADVIV